MGDLVLIAGRDPRQAGGMESYVMSHGHAAKAAGYTPHVFSLGKGTETLDTEFGVLHRCHTPMPHIRSITSVLQRRWIVPHAVRFLADRPGPHVIHGYGTWADSAVAICRALAKTGVSAIPVATAFVTIEHETVAKLSSEVIRASPRLLLWHRIELAWARAVSVRVERRAFRACAVVRVNYESVRKLLEEAYGPGLNIRCGPYAAATAFRDEAAATDEPLPEPLAQLADPAAPLIVCVSRHDGRKGVDVLIRALAGMRDAGVPFRACLLGPGSLLEEHRRLVVSLGLGGRVAVPGSVPDVMPYLRRADVYALPSLEEGSGSVSVLEALQAGVAIVSSAVDGIPEDLTDGRDALLVAPGSATDLQRALVEVLGDASLRSKLGVAARAVYEERFSAERLTEEVGSFYAELGLRAAT
jgi:glycosyltransferase involved in cell wall biosynthesis